MKKTICRMLALGMALCLSAGCAGGEKSSAESDAEQQAPQPNAPEGYVQVYMTSGSKSALLMRQTDIVWEDADETTANTVVTIDPSQTMQEIEGFGGALTHASAYVLMNMSSEMRTRILNDLFSPTNGVGYSVIRVPVGASDFTCPVNGELKHFTLDDMPSDVTDESLENFNIDVDMETIIPVLKEIQNINPDITIIAAPWSAPAWMKDSQHLYRGQLLQEYEEIYAEYLVKYAQAYKDNGIDVNYLSIQNEPMADNHDYPCMQMDEYQYARMIGLTGGKMREAGFDSIMMLGYDHNYSYTIEETVQSFVDTLYENGDDSKYMAGVAFHGYSNNGIEDFESGPIYVQETYGGKTFFTEIAEGIWSLDFGSNLNYSFTNVVLGSVNCGMSTVLYWNLVLYDDGTPVLGGGDDCIGVISVDKSGNHYSKNSAYYSMAQVSKYVQPVNGILPKAVFTESDSVTVSATGFLLGDGSTVAVVLNSSDKYAEDIDIQCGGNGFTCRLQPQTAATFIW